MITVEERVSLAPYTTLRVGGEARFFTRAENEEQLVAALTFAREHSLPVAFLGGGSNVLVPDAGVDGLVIVVQIGGLEYHEEGNMVVVDVGAGFSWDALVDDVVAKGLWGIENLAGIPGSVGGAAVQNIGAYGVELASVFREARVLRCATGEAAVFSKDAMQFAYRTSVFKHTAAHVVTRVSLRLSRVLSPRLAYQDLVRLVEAGTRFETPGDIARAVRTIRSAKFPQQEGSAGSFFKNPLLEEVQANALAHKYSGLPVYPAENGLVKVSLAWLLDHALHLKGYAVGGARLYERQPLVIATTAGATTHDVEQLACAVAAQVRRVIGIEIEREVVSLAATRV